MVPRGLCPGRLSLELADSVCEPHGAREKFSLEMISFCWACVPIERPQAGAQGPPLIGVQVARRHASVAWTRRALSLTSVPCPAPKDEPRASLHLPSSAGDVATWPRGAEGTRHPRAVSLPPSGPRFAPELKQRTVLSPC